MILYIDPAAVDMSKAVKDYHPKGEGGLTRDPQGRGTYAPTGAWGDPTLAPREKGARVVEALVAAILADIEALRRATPPEPRPGCRARPRRRAPPAPTSPAPRLRAMLPP